MPQFLFVVEMPEPGISSEDPSAASRWFTFATESNAISLPRGWPKKPSKNSWLLLSEGSDTILAQLVACAQKYQFHYSTFMISGDVTPMSAKVKS